MTAACCFWGWKNMQSNVLLNAEVPAFSSYFVKKDKKSSVTKRISMHIHEKIFKVKKYIDILISLL